MNEVTGTSDMPEYLRELLDKYNEQVILFERPSFDENAERLRRQLECEFRWSARLARPQNFITVTDIA